MADKVWGYEIRPPYEGEDTYFKENPGVAGMAAADNRITLNPYSKLTPEQQQAVARNEAARLFMKSQKFKFDFDPTPEQRKAFQGTAYEKDEDALRATLVARILTNDPSAGVPTPRQKEWADQIRAQLDGRK